MKTTFHHHSSLIVYAMTLLMAWPMLQAAVAAADKISKTSSDSSDEKPARKAEKGTAKKTDYNAESKTSVEKRSSDKTAATETANGVASEKSSQKARKKVEKSGKSAAGGKKKSSGKSSGSDTLEQSEETAGGMPVQENLLAWLYRSMGFRYVMIFLILTFNEVSLIVVIVLGLRRSAICPPELIEDFEATLNKKKYQEAFELANKDGSLLGKVLAAGMANLSDGYESALEAMRETGQEQSVRLEQRNGNIALIAQIGPMLGLLATVDGIVRSFSVIADREVTPKPSELAQGIGVALVNTIVGLTIAIASIIIYHYARNRLTRLMLEAGTISGRLMKRFSRIKAHPESVVIQGEKAYAV